MGTYQVTWKQQILAQEVRNTFYYTTDVGEPTDAEWQDVADEIRADFVAEYAPFTSDQWNFYAIEVRRVDLAGLLSKEFFPTSGTLVGSVTSDPLPTQICLLISNKGSTTKPNRARSYLAGALDSQVDNGLWTATRQGQGEALIDLQSNLNVAGTNPLSRVAAQWNSSHTQVIATNDLSGAVSKASQVPATQRRRRIGVGI